MDDKRAWFAYFAAMAGLIAITLLALFILTPKAQAQPRCGPFESVIDGLAVAQEVIVWEGTMPTAQGPVEVVMFQSAKGTWTLVAKSGTTACLMAMGKDGTEIETGRGV